MNLELLLYTLYYHYYRTVYHVLIFMGNNFEMNYLS